MPDFTKAKIYCIQSKSANLKYYGSTTQTLSARFYHHKKSLDTESKHILCHDDCDIVLMENFPCEDVNQLRVRERWYIENNKCVNIRTPGKTRKEWFTDPLNMERRNKQKKIRYGKDDEYKQKQITRASKYYHSLEGNKKKERINNVVANNKERDKIRYTCDCGTETSIRNKPNHNRSKKHLAYLSTL